MENFVIMDKFPTMLRKMWTGDEVQKWIDENIDPKEIHNKAIEEAARECDRHANSSWNDDRRIQAKLLANSIRLYKQE